MIGAVLAVLGFAFLCACGVALQARLNRSAEEDAREWLEEQRQVDATPPKPCSRHHATQAEADLCAQQLQMEDPDYDL